MNNLVYFVTPTLGLIKNYVKYKKLNPFIFIRTPIFYIFIQMIYSMMKIKNIYLTLITERWLFFFIKIIRSYYNNNYLTKKSKYILKYGFNYPVQVKMEPVEEKIPELSSDSEHGSENLNHGGPDQSENESEDESSDGSSDIKAEIIHNEDSTNKDDTIDEILNADKSIRRGPPKRRIKKEK